MPSLTLILGPGASSTTGDTGWCLLMLLKTPQSLKQCGHRPRLNDAHWGILYTSFPVGCAPSTRPSVPPRAPNLLCPTTSLLECPATSGNLGLPQLLRQHCIRHGWVWKWTLQTTVAMNTTTVVSKDGLSCQGLLSMMDCCQGYKTCLRKAFPSKAPW